MRNRNAKISIRLRRDAIGRVVAGGRHVARFQMSVMDGIRAVAWADTSRSNLPPTLILIKVPANRGGTLTAPMRQFRLAMPSPSGIDVRSILDRPAPMCSVGTI